MPTPQPAWKRPLYLVCTSLLGAMTVGLLAIVLTLDTAWSLGSWLVAGLLLMGGLIGLAVGRVWWRIVYVEERRWHNIRSH